MYASVAVYNQALPVITGPGPGGDCADYYRPTPTAVITDLVDAIVAVVATAVDTNLCSEII